MKRKQLIFKAEATKLAKQIAKESNVKVEEIHEFTDSYYVTFTGSIKEEVIEKFQADQKVTITQDGEESMGIYKYE